MIISIILLLLLVIISVKALRINLVSRPIYGWVKKNKVTLSSIEKVALQSGDVGIETCFFDRKKKYSDFPKLCELTLSSAEKKYIDTVVDPFCRRLDEWSIREANDLPDAIWQEIKQHRLWGITIPVIYNGLGFSELAHAHIITRIASKSMCAAITVMVPNALGPALFILKYGTTKQKKMLPDFSCGKEIGCFGLTSVTAGSDAGSITDSGVVVSKSIDGEVVLGLSLNWNKRYITLAPVATVLGLAVRVSDPDQLLPPGQKLGITVVLVPTQLPGITIGDRHNPMGIGLQNGPTRGHDVFVPLDHVIGGPEKIGFGWAMLMAALAGGRGLSLPGLSAALSQRVLSMTTTYAILRRQFGDSIGSLHGILSALTPMIGQTFLIKATQLHLAESMANGEASAIQSAIAKYHLTEMSRSIIQLGMDIQAGRAVQLGPNNTIAELYTALPILTTVEGANILTRHLIIFGQALLRCHPFVMEETKSFELVDTKQAFKKFDRAFFGHMLTSTKLMSKFIYRKIFKRKLFWQSKSDKSFLPGFYKDMTVLRDKYLLVIDVALLVYGKELKNTEKITVLLGDALSFLFLSLNAARYYEANSDVSGLDLVAKWACTHALTQVEIVLTKIIRRLPSSALSHVLGFWLIDKRYHQSSDTYLSDTSMAQALQQNPTLLAFLTTDCVVDANAVQACDKISAWGQLHEQLQPLFKQLQRSEVFSSKIKSNNWQELANMIINHTDLTPEQLAQIKNYAHLSWEALQVDQFNEFGRTS